jgi:GNAT superfamily N-acetyltransferase
MDAIQLMNIRLATEEDVPAIGQMWEKLAQFHNMLDSALPPAARGGGKVYARRLISRLSDSQTRVIVAEDDGVLIGYALAVIIDVIPDMFVQENSGFLADIYVDDNYRQQGIGRTLVETVKSWLRENDIHSFEWYVAEHNTVGQRFWESVGGRRVMVRMRAETE